MMGELNVQCSDKQGFYRVRSQHSNYHEDRVWQWYCHTVADKSFGHCYWTGWLNGWDQPLYVQCETTTFSQAFTATILTLQKIGGGKLDVVKRKTTLPETARSLAIWNGYDGNMDHSVSAPKVFTGLFSAHMNSPEWVANWCVQFTVGLHEMSPSGMHALIQCPIIKQYGNSYYNYYYNCK